MQTYEWFKEQMEIIKKFHGDWEKQNDLFAALLPESYVVYEFGADLLDNYIRLVSQMMADTDEAIQWWCYENDYGRAGLCVYLRDGSEHELETVEELYQYLRYLGGE